MARERNSSLRRRRVSIVAFGGVGFALLAAAAGFDRNGPPPPLLIWNASASAPIGFWQIHPGVRVSLGDMALVRTPATVRSLAAARDYIPTDVLLLKRIAAMDGETVCGSGPRILIDGRLAAIRLATDLNHRPLPWWHGCRRLDTDQYLLLNAAPDSFDSRYFGPVDRSAVIGTATPLLLP